MMAPDLIAKREKEPLEAFKALVCSAGPKSKPSLSSKFVKKMEEIPSLELSPEEPCNLSLLLAEKALIGKFTGLWPSPKTVEAWMDDRWKSLIQGKHLSVRSRQGFFVFGFSRKEDCDLVFISGPYFMGSRGLFLGPWTLDFNLEAEITAAPVWGRLPHLPLHLWGTRSLEDIGNKLGLFLDRAEPKGDQFTCARICVEVNLKKGLPEAIKLSLGNGAISKSWTMSRFPLSASGAMLTVTSQKVAPKPLRSRDQSKKMTFKPYLTDEGSQGERIH
jgi:hypothetical protein